MSIDLRQKVLSGDIKLRKKGLWVDAWEAWVMIQELTGEERAGLIEANFNTKLKKVNQKTLYPHLVILSTRYPDVDCVLDPEEITEMDEEGNDVKRTIPHPRLADFQAMMQEVGSDPRAGKLVFEDPRQAGVPDLAVRDTLNKISGGAVLELISQLGAKLSGLTPEQIEEKKAVSGVTTVTGTVVEGSSGASTTVSPEP